MLLRMLLISFMLFYLGCEKSDSLVYLNNHSKYSALKENTTLAKTNVFSKVDFEIQMLGYGSDLEGDPSHLDSRFKIGHEYSFDSDCYGSSYLSHYTAYAISNTSEDDNNLNSKFEKSLLQSVSYSPGNLTAKFDNKIETIEVDQYFSEVFNFMRNERQKLNSIINNLEQESTQKQYIKTLTPQQYISYLKELGYNVTDAQSSNTAVVSTSQATITQDEELVIKSYYNYTTGQYEKQETYLNNNKLYYKFEDEGDSYSNTAYTTYYNKKYPGRDASLKITLTK